ncbi:sigma-70 family RNA polymerase sigma factor [Variovorax sp. 160MFSha2.1]|uniref:sigma-70 family RNA polymerase sigma factor n=1 Tax=Variovorax sp. 160MFSha2.1 TaxID=3158367 RepID=UPI003AAEDED2
MTRLRSALPASPPPPLLDAAADLLENTADALPDAGDPTAALWVRWRDEQDETAREQLICHYLPYARMVAATVYSRRTHNDVEFADYLQLARVGLLEAVDRFEPGHKAQFKTFAAKRVQGAVLNGLTRLTEKNQQISVSVRLRQERLDAVKEAAAEEASDDGRAGSAPASARSTDKLFKYLAEVGIGLALGVMLEDTGMVDAEAFDGNGQVPSAEVSYFRKTEIVQLRTVLRDLVSQLSEQQRLVIRHHYLQEIPFDEIATLMGVTRGRVSQLHRQGLTRLRELLGKDARCDVSW